MKTYRPAGARRGSLTMALLAGLTLAACGDDATVKEPELLTDGSPFQYPVALWDEGIEGETVIMVRVTDMGAVDSAYVLETSGQAAFDSAAINGARDLRFAPGRRDDRRVTMWARLPVRFHMNDGPPADGGATPEAEPAGQAGSGSGATP